MPSRLAVVLAILAIAPSARAERDVLTVYSARHYQADDELYAEFTRQTGIRVEVVQGKEDELLERLKKEGKESPADVLITVDAARLGLASELGLFAPVRSKVIERRVPANLRTKDWVAFSRRARVIVYDKASVARADVLSYEALADPRLRGKVCIRSGSHPYNLSLGAALISHLGARRTEAWARGLVANFARPPKGGDTDQLRAVASASAASRS